MQRRRMAKRVAERYRNRVRECRLRAMIASQEELVRLTGIGRATVSALENNRLFLSAPYALVIARALGCRLDDLYEEREFQGNKRREPDSDEKTGELHGGRKRAALRGRSLTALSSFDHEETTLDGATEHTGGLQK